MEEAGGWRLEAGMLEARGKEAVMLESGGWVLEARCWKLKAGGWRLEARGWRQLEAGGWMLEAGGAPLPGSVAAAPAGANMGAPGNLATRGPAWSLRNQFPGNLEPYGFWNVI